MARLGPDDGDPDDEWADRSTDRAKSAWLRTLEDMRAMARDREDAGYETLTVQAGNTAPIAPDQGETDRWGLVYTAPGEDAEPFGDLVDRAAFDETGVYQAAVGRETFLVTEVLDHDAEIACFVAGSYLRTSAPPLVRAAIDRGRMYTHVKTIDGTHQGTIEHDDPAAFFPDPDSIYAYEVS